MEDNKIFIDAVEDRGSGNNLDEILSGFNMYFLSYNGSREQTRLQVPMSIRKTGLWITYVLYDKTVITEWYSEEAIDDDSWKNLSNWRVGSNMLVGDISISSDGYWVINGVVTTTKAQGEQGITPMLRVGSNNHLQISYTNGSFWADVSTNSVFTQFRVNNNKIEQSLDLGNTWTVVSDSIAAWFRWQANNDNLGRIQISRDNNTWENFSPEFINRMLIKGFVKDLPQSAEYGDIYMVGPYYNLEDSEQVNPYYRMWVMQDTWVDAGYYNKSTYNYSFNYNIKKTYPSVSAMDADKNNPIGTNELAIKIGDIVTVVNSTTPSENGIYSYEGATDGWKYQSSFNFQVEQTRSQNTNTSPSSKLFDDELVQVRSDLSQELTELDEKTNKINGNLGTPIYTYLAGDDTKVDDYYENSLANSRIIGLKTDFSINGISKISVLVNTGTYNIYKCSITDFSYIKIGEINNDGPKKVCSLNLSSAINLTDTEFIGIQNSSNVDRVLTKLETSGNMVRILGVPDNPGERGNGSNYSYVTDTSVIMALYSQDYELINVPETFTNVNNELINTKNNVATLEECLIKTVSNTIGNVDTTYSTHDDANLNQRIVGINSSSDANVKSITLLCYPNGGYNVYKVDTSNLTYTKIAEIYNSNASEFVKVKHTFDNGIILSKKEFIGVQNQSGTTGIIFHKNDNNEGNIIRAKINNTTEVFTPSLAKDYDIVMSLEVIQEELINVTKLADKLQRISNENHIIDCWGDSLTYGVGSGVSGILGGYPARLKNKLSEGWTINNFGIGGETSSSICSRNGAMFAYVDSLQIPASGSSSEFAITCENNIECDWRDLNHINEMVNPCYIAGIKGLLSKDVSTGNKYKFTREVSGEILTVKRPTPIITNGMYRKNNILIVFFGQNDKDVNDAVGYDALVNRYEKIVANNERYILLGYASGSYNTKNGSDDRKKFEDKMKERFGNHFISLREYLSRPVYQDDTLITSYGCEDAGVQPTQVWLNTSYAWGAIDFDVLTVDGIHFTDVVYDIVTNLIYDRGKALGYWA